MAKDKFTGKDLRQQLSLLREQHAVACVVTVKEAETLAPYDALVGCRVQSRPGPSGHA